MIRAALTLLLLTLSPGVFAQTGFFDVSPMDKSMEYLGAVFGGMGTLPVQGTGNSLFSEMLQIFNQVVFALGIIIVIYTGITSTIHTAQEGEVMGKKWSVIWVPFRAAAGLFLLLPSPGSGYSFIQMVMMYFIVQGVGAANQIWERVTYAFSQGQYLSQTAEGATSIANQEDFLTNFTRSEMCAYEFNNKSAELISKEKITLQRIGNVMVWKRDSATSPDCGSFELPSNPPQASQGFVFNEIAYKKAYETLVEGIQIEIEPIATEAFHDPYIAVNERDTPINIYYASQRLANSINSIEENFSNNTSVDPAIEKMDEYGWIHAGSYYYYLVSGTAVIAMDRTISFRYVQPALFVTYPDAKTKIDAKVTETITRAEEIAPGNKAPPRTYMGASIGTAGDGGAAGQALGSSIAASAKAIMDMIHHSQTTGGSGQTISDPLISIAMVGQKIMEVTESVFWTIFVVTPLLALLSIPPCANPIWGVITAIILILMTVVFALCMLLWTAGVIMGLYVPLIPWLVFTFTAIGWMMLVIEAIVAAPLVALVLIFPSEDELGKAGHSLMILLGVILRPSLMILGFILGSKVMYVAVGMLDYGFVNIIINGTYGGIGLFFWIAVIIFYVGVISTVLHQSFSLIHLVPDKALRWIGGQGESDDIMGKVKQIEGFAHKGAAAGAGAMKAGVAASKQAGSAIQKGG